MAKNIEFPSLQQVKVAPGNRLVLLCDHKSHSESLAGDTLNVHAAANSLPHALVEIRQDLIAAKSGVDEWVERVALALQPIMNDPSLAG